MPANAHTNALLRTGATTRRLAETHQPKCDLFCSIFTIWAVCLCAPRDSCFPRKALRTKNVCVEAVELHINTSTVANGVVRPLLRPRSRIIVLFARCIPHSTQKQTQCSQLGGLWVVKQRQRPRVGCARMKVEMGEHGDRLMPADAFGQCWHIALAPVCNVWVFHR